MLGIAGDIHGAGKQHDGRAAGDAGEIGRSDGVLNLGALQGRPRRAEIAGASFIQPPRGISAVHEQLARGILHDGSLVKSDMAPVIRIVRNEEEFILFPRNACQDLALSSDSSR